MKKAGRLLWVGGLICFDKKVAVEIMEVIENDRGEQ